MDSMLSTIAFALLIGAQFLAAVVLISKRRTIYAEPAEHVHREAPQSRVRLRMSESSDQGVERPREVSDVVPRTLAQQVGELSSL